MSVIWVQKFDSLGLIGIEFFFFFIGRGFHKGNVDVYIIHYPVSCVFLNLDISYSSVGSFCGGSIDGAWMGGCMQDMRQKLKYSCFLKSIINNLVFAKTDFIPFPSSNHQA